MTYKAFEDGVLMSDYDSFDIEEILECGQCFRFEKIAGKHYKIIAHGKVLNIRQNDREGVIDFSPCSMEDFENIWLDYFDLKRNYNEIKGTLFENDIVLRDAIEFARGIRILNQDTWETLISFIISQNNRIPRIKRIIQNISRKYGVKLEGQGDCYSFPTVEALVSKADIEGLMSCGAGFRAKYILDAAEKVHDGIVDISPSNRLDTQDLKKSLLQIKGVGPKVADCVLLFAFGRHEYFPVDVWVKRIMQHFYFSGNETTADCIHVLAAGKYGKNAGFAQQYLFHYARQFPELFKG